MAEIDLFKDFPKFPGLQKFFEGIGSFIEKVPEGIQEGMKYGSPSTFALPLEQMSNQYQSDLSKELAREKAEENLLDPEKLMLLDPIGGGDLENKLRRIRDTDFRKQEEELLQGTNRFPTLSETEKEKSVKDLKEETISEQLLEPRRQERAEDFRAKEEARLQGTPPTPENKEKIQEDAFKMIMEENLRAAGKGKNVKGSGGARDLDFYKKEFAKATGVDISGKPDKSNFLMALGLGLMQNRAGKGFNVGKILGAVGEATEKAMPELKEAQKEAKANMIAAGKYAMQAQAKDAATAAAASKKLNETKKYFVVPTDGKGGLTTSAYLNNYGNGRLMEFSNGQLAQLQSDPQFNNNYALLPEEDFRKVLEKSMETKEADEIFMTKNPQDINLIGSDDEAGSSLFNIRIYDVNPNMRKKYPNASPQMTEGGDRQYRALVMAYRDLQKAKGKFAEGFNIAEGTNVFKFGVDQVDALAGAFGIKFSKDLPPSKKLELFLTKLQAQNAKEILGEAGKTISDADRALVARIVGNVGLFTDSRYLTEQLSQLYDQIIVKKERQILNGLQTLDGFTKRNVYDTLFGGVGGLSSEEQNERLLRRKQISEEYGLNL
jgi:hypothetical protein